MRPRGFTRSRLRRLTVATGALILGVVASAHAATAQEPVVPFDSAGGYDHVSDPPPGAFSSVDWCFSFAERDLVGQTVEVVADGPDGPLTGTGVVAENGTVKVRVGITAGGGYTVTGMTAVESGTPISTTDVTSVDVVFDPELVDCADQLSVAPPPIESTTTSQTSSSVSPSTAPPSTDPPLNEAPGASGSTRWPLVVLSIGLLVLLAGLLIAYWPEVAVTTTRCEREQREVARIEEELRKAREAEKRYREAEERMKAEAHQLDFSRAGGAQRQRDEMRARRLRADADDLRRKAEQANDLIKTFEDQLAKAKRALDACLKRPAAGTTAPPTAPASAPEKDDKPEPCCEKGDWIGINTYGGGGAGYGRDIGTVYLICLEDASRRVVMTWSGIRAGIFAGGELSVGVFVLINSGKHPNELKADVAKVLSGWDWDISVGVSWTKLLKSGVKTAKNAGRIADLVEAVREAGKVSRAITKAERTGKTVEAARLARKNEELLEELIRNGVADDLAAAVAKGSSSAAQAGGTGANIPFGGGFQGGFWKAMDTEVDIVTLNGCKKCDPSKR